MTEMIPSVQERKKNVNVFMNSYPHLCRLKNTVPSANIKIDSSNNCLDFVGDRLKLEDWNPLLEAISNDKSLHFIGIRSKSSKLKVLQETDTESQVRQQSTPKTSPLSTNFILVNITEALSKCLTNSSALTGLVLEKIPLPPKILNNLTQGLELCQNLQQLSLPYTRIGDEGCAGLCHVLRRRLNLVWLNLTGCNVTERGVGLLCNLLKFQKLNRYGESWKQSLRCRPVNPNIMPGLRRLTLNHNPVGDDGVGTFVETLVDDLWLKALDLQHCGVTMVGGEALLNLVKENQFLSVVDVRGNLQVPNSLVAAIVQQLAENNRDTTPEFQWLNEENPKSCRGSSTSNKSESRSTQFLSNTTLLSKGLSNLSVLPSKSRVTWPQLAHSLPVRTRSSSAKRTHTSNNSPRPPWNWNVGNPTLKRGNSEQLMITNPRQNHEVLLELRSVKEQLKEVSRQLQEETARRVKAEQELEKYKQMTELSDNSMPVDKAMLQTIFHQFYNAYLTKESTELPQRKIFTEEDEVALKKHDSTDSVIRTINGENPPGLKLDLKKCKSSSNHSSESPRHPPDTPSRAQLLFESLITS